MRPFQPDTERQLRFFWIWQTAAWMIIAAIVWLSLTPAPPQPPKLLSWDKLQHLVAYGSAAFWFGSVFRRHILWPLFLVALGIALEFLQDLGGVRTLEVADMIANSLGVVAGWWGATSPAGRWMIWLESKIFGRRA